jgi:hypothetical protein
MAVLEVGYSPHGRAGTGLKKEVCRLVGYTREEKHPVLSTSEAYDVAYDTILSALRGDPFLENP